MYKDRREWADTYVSKVLCILNTLIPHLAVLAIASDETDKKYATDLEVKLLGGTIAVRLRKPDCQYRDLTIRALLDSGTTTELAKIKAGYAYRYFYGWVDDNGNIAEWILVDLDKVREMGLLEKERRLIPNGDGTFFISIPIRELRQSGCLLDSWPQVSTAEGIERAKQRSYAAPPKLTDKERAIISSFPRQEALW